ncbi:hypothetical protein ACOSKC_002749 [Providencia stuartii]
MAYQPPFTITTDILNLVAQISQQVGELNASQLNASPQLRKQNRIKTITGTLAIEGNTLTEEQITAIVEGKPVLGSVRELAEVKGAIAAYDALPTFTPSAINDLLTAHGLMLSDILVNAGAFRSKGVGIHKGGGGAPRCAACPSSVRFNGGFTPMAQANKRSPIDRQLCVSLRVRVYSPVCRW